MILVLASLFRRMYHYAHASRLLDEFGVHRPVNSVAPSVTMSLSGIPTSSVKSTKDFPASFLEVIGSTLVTLLPLRVNIVARVSKF
jgi:hypothetical protein